jgi:Zn-dependent protease with chaperone function
MTRVSISNFESGWLNELASNVGPIPPDRLEAVRLPVVCGDPRFRDQLGDWCGNLSLASTLDALALATLVVAVGLIVILVASRLLAPRLGARLGRVFRVALVGLLVGLLILMVAGSIVIVGGLYTSELSATGGFHPYVEVIGATTGLALTLGGFRALAALWTIPAPSIPSVPITRAGEPRVFELIDRLAQKVSVEPPTNVLAGLSPRFFVTEGPVRAFDKPLDGRTMYLSLPMCRILEVDELEAVLGHELGHYRGGDTTAGQQFYPIYSGSLNAFGAYLQSTGGLAGIVALLPANVLALFFGAFARAERRMSRQRELAADEVGAESTTRAALGSALLKLHWHAATWDVVKASSVRKIRGGFAPGNLSVEFAALARPEPHAVTEDEASVGAVENALDSHPPLAVRLDRLGGRDASEARARVIPPVHPAIALFDAPEELELRLVKRDQGLIAARLGVEPTLDPSAPGAAAPTALRAAASDDAFVASVIDQVEARWGYDLVRPVKLRGHWVVLAELAIEPSSEPAGATFITGIPRPSGNPVRVIGLADRSAEGDFVIPADARLVPLGFAYSDRLRLQDLYLLDDRMVIVEAIGDGTLEAQLAGLFVVPTEDPLIGPLTKLLDESDAELEVDTGPDLAL